MSKVLSGFAIWLNSGTTSSMCWYVWVQSSKFIFLHKNLLKFFTCSFFLSVNSHLSWFICTYRLNFFVSVGNLSAEDSGELAKKRKRRRQENKERKKGKRSSRIWKSSWWHSCDWGSSPCRCACFEQWMGWWKNAFHHCWWREFFLELKQGP